MTLVLTVSSPSERNCPFSNIRDINCVFSLPGGNSDHQLSRDPIEEQGGMNLYGFVDNNSITGFDSLGLDGWRLDMSDHGGPHIQNGNYRYDAITFKPIQHNGVTPPKLTPGDIDELRKSGVLDQVRKRLQDSIVREASDEMSKELTKGGARCLSKKAAKELAKQILKKIPVVTILFVAADSTQSGVPNAAANAVIPVDLIQNVADEGERKLMRGLISKKKASGAASAKMEALIRMILIYNDNNKENR